MRIDVMGVGFDSLTMDEAVARARDLMAERRAAYVVTPNPEIVMLCREDAAAMQAVQNADLVLADGIGVIYGAKILGTPLRAKLPGIDFAAALMTQMGREGKRVFFARREARRRRRCGREAARAVSRSRHRRHERRLFSGR